MELRDIENLLILVIFIGVIAGVLIFFDNPELTGLTTMEETDVGNYGLYLIILGIVIGAIWIFVKNKINQ